MDILWGLLTLPYAPMRGLTAVVKVIAREAEAQRYDPANIRRELEELDAAAAAGDITSQERDLRQQQVLDRLTGTGGGAARSAAPDAGRAGNRPARARRLRETGQRRRADRPGDPDRRRGR
ncbi:gas vesicle protein GvpG [Micromonospora cremea]|uniref:Gas vesicle protein G n=1 Tax=Micromonospora cremea TaxID=709881 RepID=A0A1N5ZQV9_9ACTN|nr:gas vesicle protein GvpG [Micromonospora cremea]SIN24165.1 Gas vesicle protein G [Micromonospora cremea]